MSYNPYGGRYTYGGNLKHSRKAISEGGMPNGFRADGTRPVGQKRRGMIIGTRPDGTPIYSYGPQSAGQKSRNTANLSAAVNRRSNNISSSQRQRNTYKLNAAVNGETRSQQPKGQNLNVQMVKRDINSTGERVGKAVNKARSGLGEWLNARREDLRNAGKNIGNWLSDRGKDISRFGKSAYEAVSNSDERRAYEEAAANYKKDPNAANRYRMNNAKKAYDSHLLTRLGRGSKDVADTVGRTVSNAARGARDAISNQDERKAYEEADARFRKNPTKKNRKARNDAKKAYDSHLLTRLDRGAKQGARNVAKGARDFWDYTKPGGTLDRKAIGAAKSGAEAVGKAISNRDERRAYEEAAANYKKDPNAANRYRMNNAKKAYDSHLLTRAERGVNSVADTVGNTLKNIGEYASQKSSQAAKLLSSLPSSMKSTARDMLDNIKSGKTKEDIDAALSDFMSFVSASNNTATTSKGRKGNR